MFSQGEGRTDWQTAILPKVDSMTLEQCLTSGGYGMASLGSLILCPLMSTVARLRQNLGLTEDRG